MDRSTLQQKLNQPYTTENWREIVQHVFPNVQIFNPPQVIPVSNDKVETFRQLGNVTLQDGKTLALFELKLKPNVNILRNRVELNTIVSQYIDQERTHGVLSIFEQGTDDYRFTFSARATEYDEDSGDFNTKKTDTKRYTYVLGRNESCKTPAARFAELADKKATTNIQSIQDAFSVEKLSKEFFKEYKVHYQKMVDYLLATDAYKRGIFHGDEKAVRDFVKLLMGRLVFIQFVQKKRWMGVPADIAGWHDGPVNFLYQGFLDFEYKETFYSAFLEPLFYDTLNTPNRPGDLFSVTGTKVPYLNGGLFEQGDTDTSLINFPEDYFADLLEFFDRYNFTIDENDLSEKEIGIDPEMLGHIFENLLEDNKDKGAFYTPKEIVHYMCQESLKEYLKTQLENHGVLPSETDKATELEQCLEAFVKRKEASGVIDFDGILAKALRDVKICDPAIGSGAFPMGLLTEIFRCMYVLYHASPDTVGEIWDMDDWQPETVKKNIIQNSIYGVDIEKGAVDIARLRFWLSLIVDEPEPHALPNLDYKIVVGDSLVSKFEDEIIEIDWEIKEGTQGNLFGNENVLKRQALLKKITSKQQEYFHVTDKQKLAAEIRNLKIDILINQLELMINTKGLEKKPTESGKKAAAQMDLWLQTRSWKNTISKLQKLKQNKEESFEHFDWKLDFPEVLNPYLVNGNAGFDIVIGNPPYFEISEPKIKTLFQNRFRNVLSGHYDLYIFFFQIGIELIKQSGVMAYITPHTFLHYIQFQKLREYIFLETSIIEITERIPQVFEKAVVDTSISLLKKDGFTSNHAIKFSSKSFTKDSLIDVDFEYRKQNELSSVTFDINSIRKLFELQKYSENCVSLGDAIESSQGITVYAKVQGEKVNYFRTNGKEKYSKPFMKGRDFDKYKSSWVDGYIIYGKHLWCPRDPKFFESPKIFLRQTADRLIATYIKEPFYAIDSVHSLIEKSRDFNLKYVLAILNSTFGNYLYQLLISETGKVFAQVKLTFLRQIPIKKCNHQQPFMKIVDYIIFLKSQGLNSLSDQLMPTYFEQIIDGMVYELYFPELIKKHKREIIQHLGELPEFTDKMSDEQKMKICKTVFNRLNDREHPVRVNLFYMSSIPEIAIIEGKYENN